MKRKQKPLMECRTLAQVCEQPRDNISSRGFWLCSDSYTVSIHQQKSGEPAKQEITVPKGIFDCLIRWYTTGRMNKSPKGRSHR